MKTEFKKWLCKKAIIINGMEFRYPVENKYNAIVLFNILVKAMLAINREGKYFIDICRLGILVGEEGFSYKDYSEQEALEKALEYIFNEAMKQVNEQA